MQKLYTELLQRENQELRAQLAAHKIALPLNASNFTSDFIKDNDVKTCYYTGLPIYSVFCTLFHMLKDYACPPPMPEPKGMTEFFAVLVKLRLDLPMTDISYRLDRSLCTYSSIFHKWLDVMYDNLSQLVEWPDTETQKANLPIPFQKHYSSVKCIIDCFEVFIERPESFTATVEQQNTQITKNITLPKSLLLYHPRDPLYSSQKHGEEGYQIK